MKVEPKRPMPFAKVYGRELLTSTLWEESAEVLKLFMAMLLMADEDGYVDLFNVMALGRIANLSKEATERALLVLESPDELSRTKEHDGRRVLRTEDGRWFVVNAKAYREYRTAAQVAEAERKARKRNGTSKPKGRPRAPAEHSDADLREIAAFDNICGNGPFSPPEDD